MFDSPRKLPQQDSLTTRCWALIPCAGTGARAGAQGPKQYQTLAGQPMVTHTLAAFAAVSRIDGVLVVVVPGDDFFDSCEAKHWVAACGGATRAQSVTNGLRCLMEQGAAPNDWVLVHDAARCLVTPGQINALIDACQYDPVGGLLAHRVADTLKCAAQGRVVQTLGRSDKWLAQTPQMFRIGQLVRALELAGADVTDESSAIESMGLQPLLVAASSHNFKVTYPEDFALAQALLNARGLGSRKEQ